MGLNTNMKFTVGNMYTACTQELYRRFNGATKFGLELRRSVDGDTEYFDAINRSGNVVCMDGETVEFEGYEGEALVFKNVYGEEPETFELTNEEASSAII